MELLKVKCKCIVNVSFVEEIEIEKTLSQEEYDRIQLSIKNNDWYDEDCIEEDIIDSVDTDSFINDYLHKKYSNIKNLDYYTDDTRLVWNNTFDMNRDTDMLCCDNETGNYCSVCGKKLR